jgi:hypothetical protein
MIPSVQTISMIRSITRDQAVSIRHAMYQYEKYQRMSPCAYPPSIGTKAGVMGRICEIIDAYGVEYIPQGKNKRSPAITYVNMGDTYDWTVLMVNGRFRIGAWGDIVERGNYE